ncbi:MAG: tetratricopeptide repeat protein [bacterium]
MKTQLLLKIAKNGLWLAAGTALILLLFEAAFRVAGIFFFKPAEILRKEGEHVVLCEGDSFTFGVGGTAYPRQMEGILNNRSAGAGFRVINNGIPSSNTSMIYKRLASDIPKLRPDTVIMLAGAMNRWNLAELDLAGFRWPVKLDKFLLNFRVYKFGKLLYIGFRHSDFSAFRKSMENIRLENPVDKNQKIPVDRFLKNHIDGAVGRTADSAATFFGKGELDKAVAGVITTLELVYALDTRHGITPCRFENQPVLREILAAAESRYPDSEKVIFALGEYSFRSALLNESIGYFKMALQKHPRSARSYAGLAMCLMERHDADEAYKLVQKALAIQPYDFKVRMAVARHHFNRPDYHRAAGEMLKVAGDKRFILQNFIPEIYLQAREGKKAGAFALKVPIRDRLPSTWWIIALYWEKKGRDEKALKALEDGLRRYPKASVIANALLSHFLSKGKSIQELLKYGETIPEFKNSAFYAYYSKLLQDSRRTGKDPLLLVKDSRSLLSELLGKDIMKTYKLTRKYGARLILASYPAERYQEVEKAAREYKIRYINFKKLFGKAFASKTEFISTDGCHCNTLGYRYMADILADEVLHPERSFDPESIKP